MPIEPTEDETSIRKSQYPIMVTKRHWELGFQVFSQSCRSWKCSLVPTDAEGSGCSTLFGCDMLTCCHHNTTVTNRSFGFATGDQDVAPRLPTPRSKGKVSHKQSNI